jgi:hypothetical protein
MYNKVQGSLSGGFLNIERDAFLDSSCLYDAPPAGYCSSGYGDYGDSSRQNWIYYAYSGQDGANGCVGFPVNLVDLDYRGAQDGGGWFTTGEGNASGFPRECDPTL